MARVKLGDVAREYKATIKNATGLPTVGLEHLTPSEIVLERWDEGAENTFTKGFKKGHMLFGRRRAYLKKAALAPFDGICSGDIIVIEAIPEKIHPELLPFIIQNDLLFDYAVGNSAGSLSPRVKWESLKDYEFELPDLDKQDDMVELLKAAHRTRKAYQNQIAATDELVKSQFIEMFGDPFSGQKWPTKCLGEISLSILDGTNIPTSTYTSCGDVLFLRIQNVWCNELRLEDSVYVSSEVNQRYINTSLHHGDLLITKIGRYNTKDSSLGRVAVYRGENDRANYSNNIMRIRLRPGFNSEFINALMNLDIYQQFIKRTSQGSTDKRALSKALISSYPIICPPQEAQDQFADLLIQSDKSKFELEQAVQRIDNLIKSLIQQDDN